MPIGREEKTEPEHKIGVVCEKEKHKVVCVKDEIKIQDSVNVQPFSVNLDIDMLNKLNSGSCVIGSTIPVTNQQPEKVAVCKEGKTIKIFKIVEEKK